MKNNIQEKDRCHRTDLVAEIVYDKCIKGTDYKQKIRRGDMVNVKT